MSAPVRHGDGPLVVALLRITDLRPEVDPLTGSVRQDAWGIGLSAPDGAALEHALRICRRVVGAAVGRDRRAPEHRAGAPPGGCPRGIGGAGAGA